MSLMIRTKRSLTFFVPRIGNLRESLRRHIDLVRRGRLFRRQQCPRKGDPRRWRAVAHYDHVLVETWTLLRHRILRQAAERFWEGVRAGVAAIEPVGVADLEAAWHIEVSYRDQDFSIVDRTSFAVMRRLGIERAASLDNPFAVFRFGPNRRQAFTVVG
jgi:predicted nucleic acid-binding protein